MTWVWAEKSYSLEHNTVIAKAPANSPKANLRLSFDLTFSDGEAVKGKHLIKTLGDFSSLAEAILRDFEL